MPQRGSSTSQGDNNTVSRRRQSQYSVHNITLSVVRWPLLDMDLYLTIAICSDKL